MLHGDFFHHLKRECIKLYRKAHPLDPKVRIVDALCMFASIGLPFSTLPQIIKLYTSHNPDGISILMWLLYSILTVPMFAYGIIHKVKPLIVINALYLIANTTMLIGLYIYL